MSEVKDLENEALSQAEPVLPDTAEKTVPTSQGVKGKWKNMPRKKRHRMIRRIIALVVVLAVVVGLIKVFGGKKTDDADRDGYRTIRFHHLHRRGQRIDQSEKERDHHAHYGRNRDGRHGDGGPEGHRRNAAVHGGF